MKIDGHHHIGHLGKSVDDVLRHMDAHQVERAVLLAIDDIDGGRAANANELVLAEAARRPERFIAFVHVDPRREDRIGRLRRLAEAGGRGFGEHKLPMAVDDPRAVELYQVAGDMGLPVLIHFEHGRFNTGLARFDDVLRRCPRTVFIGHGQTWWANIEAGQERQEGYPSGPISAAGLIDRWLAQQPNLYADLSARSGLNALSRDRGFARGFVTRHWGKLIWGTDCPCRDGAGGGFEGRCFGRQMLGLLDQLCGSHSEQLGAIVGGNLAGLLGL
ncbi:MAG: amidohydrolase family protein [Phycisphaerae bacterium]